MFVIVTEDFEIRVGARTLLNAPGQQLRVQPGDRIGLVGRNGAGKTTTMRILAGESEPYGGKVFRSGTVGYLPQDSREGNIEQTARDRVLSARGLDRILSSMERQQEIMETTFDDSKRDAAIRKYSRDLFEFFAVQAAVFFYMGFVIPGGNAGGLHDGAHGAAVVGAVEQKAFDPCGIACHKAAA